MGISRKTFDFIVVGAGIFGLSSAFSLKTRGYSVCLVNEDEIPSPKASSSDISKIVRMEYGSDREYMEMAERSLETWQMWNDLFGQKVYHETGFLLLCRESLESEYQSFERDSLRLLKNKGLKIHELNSSKISSSYPAFDSHEFQAGFYNPKGGFVESSQVLRLLSNELLSMGVEIRNQSRVHKLRTGQGGVQSLVLENQSEIQGERFIFCTGCHTAKLLQMEEQFEISGHPIFHLKIDPTMIDNFSSPKLPVFSADISNTGWYGFPLHPKENVVKIARHGKGILLDPRLDPLQTSKRQEEDLRSFLKQCIPDLAEAPIAKSRLCCYTDTPDGHFWIDYHHEWKNLVVATGGSGHGFKMGPELGEMIALTALGEKHRYSDRYQARNFSIKTIQDEQARANG